MEHAKQPKQWPENVPVSNTRAHTPVFVCVEEVFLIFSPGVDSSECERGCVLSIRAPQMMHFRLDIEKTFITICV